MANLWSEPVLCDLSRSTRRTSVPIAQAEDVPETPGVYVICTSDTTIAPYGILDIGEAGPRPNWVPHGLRGRLATDVPHSACERLARAIHAGTLPATLYVVWWPVSSKEEAKNAQDALLTLYRLEHSRQPPYNVLLESHPNHAEYQSMYSLLLDRLRATRGYPRSDEEDGIIEG